MTMRKNCTQMLVRGVPSLIKGTGPKRHTYLYSVVLELFLYYSITVHALQIALDQIIDPKYFSSNSGMRFLQQPLTILQDCDNDDDDNNNDDNSDDNDNDDIDKRDM